MKLFKDFLGQMKGEIEGVIKDSEALYGESTQSKLKKKNLEKKAQEIEMVFKLVQFDQKSLDQGPIGPRCKVLGLPWNWYKTREFS